MKRSVGIIGTGWVGSSVAICTLHSGAVDELLLNDLKTGVIPGIPNRTEEDHVFLSYDAPAREGVVAVLAAGMGNVFSAALFEPCAV